MQLRWNRPSRDMTDMRLNHYAALEIIAKYDTLLINGIQVQITETLRLTNVQYTVMSFCSVLWTPFFEPSAESTDSI